mgnify:CR=1 FL=1
MKPGIKGNPRLHHIDFLKCLAIYLVLIYHGTLYNNAVYPDMPVSALLRYFSRSLLSACVPLFFFVNGYLLLPRPMDLKKHTRKMLRLMVVTCFWVLFLRLALQPYFGDYYTWETFWTDCWELRDGWNNQLWYMGSLISVYLLFPVLKSAFDGDRRNFFWLTAVAVFLVFGSKAADLGVTVLRLLARNEYNMYYNDFPVFYMFNPFSYRSGLALAYFCLGGAAWALEQRLQAVPARWRNLAATVGLLLCCAMLGIIGWRFSLYRGKVWDQVWHGYDTVFTLGSVACLYVLSLNWQREVALVKVISANTLGIYLIHDLIHKYLSPSVMQFTSMQTLPGTLVYGAALLLITLGVCLVLKKIPLVKYLVS